MWKAFVKFEESLTFERQHARRMKQFGTEKYVGEMFGFPICWSEVLRQQMQKGLELEVLREMLGLIFFQENCCVMG